VAHAFFDAVIVDEHHVVGVVARSGDESAHHLELSFTDLG
jgi:7-keto-8-aminopelargonate synthetase-like enzyme